MDGVQLRFSCSEKLRCTGIACKQHGQNGWKDVVKKVERQRKPSERRESLGQTNALLTRIYRTHYDWLEGRSRLDWIDGRNKNSVAQLWVYEEQAEQTNDEQTWTEWRDGGDSKQGKTNKYEEGRGARRATMTDEYCETHMYEGNHCYRRCET